MEGAGNDEDGRRQPPRATAHRRLADRGARDGGPRGSRPNRLRRELEAIADPAEREQRVSEVTEHPHEHAGALSAATIFVLDDVIDPAGTRRLIAATVAAADRAGLAPSAGHRPDTR